MKHILLPTDFSDNSWNAIQYAIQLFKNEKCVFSLINTYEPMMYMAEDASGYTPEFGLDESIKDLSIKSLNAFLERISETLEDNPKHEFKIYSLFNRLVSGIKEVMLEHTVDLIVMGTQGATGAKEVFFGSNTVQVFKEIKCPTLSIPSGFEYEALDEILFPTDLLVDYNAFQIELLIEIASANKSRVNVLHISNDDLTVKETSKQLELESLFKETPYLFHLSKSKNVIAAIEEFQIRSKTNLLAMIHNKHTFFEKLFFKSNVDQLGFHSKVPFLVIPSKY